MPCVILVFVTPSPMEGASKTLHEFAYLMMAVTAANGSVPPAAASWDCGGSNHLVNALYLGLLPSQVMKDLPFFGSCTKKKVDIPLFIFQPLFAEGNHFLSGCNDPFHVMKRYSHHLATGCRVVRLGALLVNLTPLVRGG